jgi:ketosteroid isomerase-like protein
MRANLPAIIGILALSIPSGESIAGSIDGGPTPDQWQEIATIPEVYVERALAGDWEAVSELYHEEAIQILPDAPPVEGREAIRAALAQMFGAEGGVELTDFSVDILESETLGETVYVRATYHFEVEPLGGAADPVQQHGPYVNILRQDTQDTWLIWRQFVNRAHPPIGPTPE